jgi:hypothetical protein
MATLRTSHYSLHFPHNFTPRVAAPLRRKMRQYLWTQILPSRWNINFKCIRSAIMSGIMMYYVWLQCSGGPFYRSSEITDIPTEISISFAADDNSFPVTQVLGLKWQTANSLKHPARIAIIEMCVCHQKGLRFPPHRRHVTPTTFTPTLLHCSAHSNTRHNENHSQRSPIKH